MANTLTEVIPQLLAQGLLALREAAFMPLIVNRGFDTMAGDLGSTIDVPIPSAIAAVAVTPAATPPATADIAPTKVSLAMDQWYEAPFYLTDKEMLEVMSGTIPMQASEAVKALANNVNSYIMGLYTDFYGFAGTAGTTPFASDTSDATEARKILQNQLAPPDPRYMIIDPDAEANALNLRAFQDASFGGSGSVILEGQINRKLGFNWLSHQLVPTHTNGTSDGAYLVNDAATVQGAKTLDVDTGTGTYVVGDLITIAGDTQTYVITAAYAGGAGTLAIEPGLVIAPPDDAAITDIASHVVNLAMHRDAIAFANRPLAGSSHPSSLISQRVDELSGLALRLEVSREHKRDRFSFDILYGAKVVRRELGTRLAG